jgi:hypothetical protein
MTWISSKNVLCEARPKGVHTVSFHLHKNLNDVKQCTVVTEEQVLRLGMGETDCKEALGVMEMFCLLIVVVFTLVHCMYTFLFINYIPPPEKIYSPIRLIKN